MLTFAERRRPTRVSLFTLFAVVAFGLLGAASASAALPGSVYTQTNAVAGNEVVVFTRAADGTLTETSRAATGGIGDDSTPPFAFEILDSSGGVELSDSRHLVFAVNAGSDTLSSFRVLSGGGLELVGSVPTGDLPISVDSHGDVVYVLNEGDLGPNGPFDVDGANARAGTIQGYRAAANGQLTPIAGSLEPLSLTGSAAAVPAQISFDPTGRTLTVTHRIVTGAPPTPSMRIDTFVLGADSTPGTAIPNAGTGAAPFGFDYDANGRMIVGNALDGSISSYQLNSTTGVLTLLDNEPTTEGAPCWVEITPDNRFAFVTNTNSGTITRLEIAANGTLTELGQTAVPGAGAAADVALSPDGEFLYVLVPQLTGASTSQINTYDVGANGSLTLLDETSPANLPAGVSGLVASAADSTPPDTTITAGPAAGSRTNDSTPTFSFAAVPASEPNPTFVCSIDGGAATPCASPFTTTSLAEGAHTLSVAAVDFGGNVDASPATRSFTIDTVAPNTTIDAGPPNGGTTSDTTPTFGFTSSEEGSTFRCSIDGGAFVVCTSPLTTTALSSGSHTFTVVAVDSAGNVDATPATRTFTVRSDRRPQPGCSLNGTQRVGNSANNTLTGNSAMNILFGLGGNDTLRGRGNRDCLYGGSGNDRLDGGFGADRMSGNTGNDRLTDNRGRDVFDGGSGTDRINSRDVTRADRRQRDTVRCGTGRRDVAHVDRRDNVSRDCERVFRRSI